MFGIADYPAFVAAVIVFLMIPGPGNLALITSTGKGGLRGGFACTFGVIAGDQVLMWLAVAGVAALLSAYPTAFHAVQWLGAAYLAWLGARMLLAKPGDKLSEIMLKEPFALKEDALLEDALKEALGRHYPVYPVVSAEGVLAGLVRGETLFANRAIAISGQSGSMVGVDKEERFGTPVKRSLLLRHPWLQINLLTAFIAAAVVGAFEGTLDKLVILAVFLPVMAGQTGNTGCQALAVTLRGMTLGDLKSGSERSLVFKEGTLGFFNGLLVGVVAGIGMLVYATMQGEAHPLVLGMVVTTSMVIACTVASIAGALIPLGLKKLGADPATASSIFLTTASDVASMGIFLSMATALLM